MQGLTAANMSGTSLRGRRRAPLDPEAGDRFYQSNVNAWAIDPHCQTRKVLYNLYHAPSHDNLFGGGYAGRARRMVGGLATEIS